MSQWIKHQVLLLKMESSYGVDTTPTGAANALLVEDFSITPFNMAMQERDYAIKGFARELGIPADFNARIQFAVDFTTGAAAGVAPAFGPAMRACGMAETIVADTSVTYAPADSTFESVCSYALAGPTQHKLLGLRGTVSFGMKGKLPKLNFDMLGLMGDVADITVPSRTYAGMLPAKPLNKANTAFAIDGDALVLNSLTLNQGNSLVYRDKPNYEAVDIDERNTTGQCDVHQAALSTFNAFAIAKGGAGVPIVLTHTLDTGRTAALNVPVAQLGQPSYGADGNQRLLSLPFMARRNGSNPDFSIVCT